MARPFPILGFDVGGTKVAVSLVLSDGTLVSSARVPNKEREPDDVLPAMVSAGKSLLADAGMTRDDLMAVGVCTPSPLDFWNGIVMRLAISPKMWLKGKNATTLSGPNSSEVRQGYS